MIPTCVGRTLFDVRLCHRMAVSSRERAETGGGVVGRWAGLLWRIVLSESRRPFLGSILLTITPAGE
jgi:hypothetical protein